MTRLSSACLRSLAAVLVLAAFSLPCRAFEQETKAGNITAESSFLIQAGPLENVFEPASGYNVFVDGALAPHWAATFGGGYYSPRNLAAPGITSNFSPLWAGIKYKTDLRNLVEIYAEADAAAYYLHAYSPGVDSLVDAYYAGFIFGLGYDLWLTKGLIAGLDTRYHFMFQGGQVYPMVQIGLRLGLRR